MAPFEGFAQKMTAAGLPDVVVRTFRHYYNQLVAGETGMIPERTISAVGEGDVAHHASLAAFEQKGVAVLGQTAVLKLNGGLGTSMGLSKAKSLIEVRNGLTFLDCAVLQVRSLRKTHNARIPFVLMNSFSTDEDSCRLLERYPDIHVGLPVRFLQHKFPKVLKDTLEPALWPADPALEWNPPGHGDIYPALVTSKMLALMRSRGIRYVFISNSDNLGAALDLRILGYVASRELPFAMEVCERGPMDKKGGHVARASNGRLILRESAQCPAGDMDAFQDISRHRYFNTNNLWLDLVALAKVLAANEGVLPLPLIVNPKTLDPKRAAAPAVYQLESAMGAAIGVFEGAAAIAVPRERFVPVKKCNDLLTVWSDRYALTREYLLRAQGDITCDITVDLDSKYYTRFDDFKARFASGAPSLRGCTKLRVVGDVRFGRNVRVEGAATVTNKGQAQATVENGAVLSGDRMFE